MIVSDYEVHKDPQYLVLSKIETSAIPKTYLNLISVTPASVAVSLEKIKPHIDTNKFANCERDIRDDLTAYKLLNAIEVVVRNTTLSDEDKLPLARLTVALATNQGFKLADGGAFINKSSNDKPDQFWTAEELKTQLNSKNGDFKTKMLFTTQSSALKAVKLAKNHIENKSNNYLDSLYSHLQPNCSLPTKPSISSNGNEGHLFTPPKIRVSQLLSKLWMRRQD